MKWYVFKTWNANTLFCRASGLDYFAVFLHSPDGWHLADAGFLLFLYDNWNLGVSRILNDEDVQGASRDKR